MKIANFRGKLLGMRNFQDTFDHLISDIVPSQTVGDHDAPYACHI